MNAHKVAHIQYALLMLLLTVVFNSAWSNVEAGAKVWNGDLTAQQLPQFSKGRYTQINGNVWLVQSGLSTLSELKRLTRVEGDVFIGNVDKQRGKVGGNPTLQSLSGLAQLRHISGYLVIANNKQLINLNGLNGVRHAGNVHINDNVLLNSLDGLNQLKTLDAKTGTLEIWNNPSLSNIRALSQLTVAHDVSIANNDALISLQGLGGLVFVAGRFEIENHQQLNTLQGLTSLQTVGVLSIYNNWALETLQGLNQLNSVDSMSIQRNEILHSTQGLDKLTRIHKRLRISRNKLLTSLDGFGALLSLGDFELDSNLRLKTLSGFKQLKTLGSLKLERDYPNTQFPQLTTIKSLWVDINAGIPGDSINRMFPKVAKVNSLRIGDVKQLSIQGFLPSLEQVDDLSIYGHHGLSNFDGLNKLKTIGNLDIRSPSLTSITGFNGLEKVTGMIRIHETGIKHLKGFRSIKAAKEIGVYQNKRLQVIDGFHRIQTPLQKLTIQDNERLHTIKGFKKLKAVQSLNVIRNQTLKIIQGFSKLNTVDAITLLQNPQLKKAKFPKLNHVFSAKVDNGALLSSLKRSAP